MNQSPRDIALRSHLGGAERAGSTLVARPSDPWQALHPQYAVPLSTLPALSPHGVDLRAIREAVSTIPDVPAGTNFRWGNMETVGAPLELPTRISSEDAVAYLLHAWAVTYKAVVFDSQLPVEMAGRWGLLSDNQIAFLAWFNIGGPRLVVLPTLSLQGRTIHMSLYHCVLCHQGWMTAHNPSKHGDLVHLSSQYDHLFFQPGGAYYELNLAFHDKLRPARYWHRHRTWIDSVVQMLGGRKLGIGDGEIDFCGGEYPGTPIFWSQELHSFFHFKVGEHAVPSGSPPGVTYSHLRTKIAEMMGEWRRTFVAPNQTKLERPKRVGIEVEYLEEQ